MNKKPIPMGTRLVGFVLSMLTLLTAVSTAPVAYAQVCSPLTSAPNLYEISRTAPAATLYFTPLNDQIVSYTVVYGFRAEDERYSTTFNYGSSAGAVSYTINGLDPAQSYWFQVRANNECGTSSPWSGWKSDNYTGSAAAIAGVGGPSASQGASQTTRPAIPVTGPEMALFALALPVVGLVGGAYLFTFPTRRK